MLKTKDAMIMGFMTLDIEGNKYRRRESLDGMYKIIVFTVVFLCSFSVSQGADPVFTDPTLNDTYGNKADSKSNITWAGIPEGKPYKAGKDYNDGGLGPLFEFARAFLGIVQPNPFPEGRY